MTIEQPIAIYGAGGFGREVAWLIETCNADRPDRYHIVGFVDDNATVQGTLVNNLPVFSPEALVEQYPGCKLANAVGSPRAREMVVQRVESMGLPFVTLLAPDMKASRRVEWGTGVVVCAGNILTTNISIGHYVQVNLACTIGHDAILGEYTTLAPGVHISGWVHIGRRAYIGTGAVIINGTADAPLTIGDDAVVGAGACVARSVAAGETVVGVPARPIGKSER